MARALWTGYLSFGLVNVPVGLFSATEDRTVHFNQLHKGTSHRIRYKKIDEETGAEVETSDIVNGYDLGGGEYVVVTRDELKAAAPGRSDAIEISDFVNLDEIDPIYFRQTYYLAPHGKGSDKAYTLLRSAMAESGKVGIATLVLRDKEHLVAVRPGDEVLILETMYFSDEIREPRVALETLPPVEAPGERELDIAERLIDSLGATWDPSRYRNTYRERVEALVEEKRAGHTIVIETERPKANVIDLMAALEASIARSRTERGATEETAKAPATKTRRSGVEKNTPAEQQRFAGMSKSELLAQAESIDLPGRSKMTKLELVQALATAPTAKRRSRRAS